jgi:hypothetical protein
MEKIPEHQFGRPDILAIFGALIAFGLSYNYLPDQVWISEDETILLVVRLVLSFVIGGLVWAGLINYLIPSDAEIMDIHIRRRIIGEVADIRNDADAIRAKAGEFRKNFPEKAKSTYDLGETITRVMDALVEPDLKTLAEIDGKINRFLEILSTFALYASGSRRTTQAKFDELVATYVSALSIMTNAMETLEHQLNNPNLSRVKVLEQTIEDLAGMDGLLIGREVREKKDQIKKEYKERENEE